MDNMLETSVQNNHMGEESSGRKLNVYMPWGVGGDSWMNSRESCSEEICLEITISALRGVEGGKCLHI